MAAVQFNRRVFLGMLATAALLAAPRTTHRSAPNLPRRTMQGKAFYGARVGTPPGRPRSAAILYLEEPIAS